MPPDGCKMVAAFAHLLRRQLRFRSRVPMRGVEGANGIIVTVQDQTTSDATEYFVVDYSKLSRHTDNVGAAKGRLFKFYTR